MSTQYGKQVGQSEALALRGAARASRPVPTPVQNEGQEARLAAMRRNEALIRGRTDRRGVEVWDVFQVLGGEVVSLYVRGCSCYEEALELAGHLLSGRTFVSLSAARALLRAGGACHGAIKGTYQPSVGGVLVPGAGGLGPLGLRTQRVEGGVKVSRGQ